MSTASLSARSSMESLQSVQSSLSAPDTLPPAVAGPMVWAGSELDPAKYVVQLAATEIADIRSGVISFKLSHLPHSAIDKDTFPLSSKLSTKLSAISANLHQGFGVSVLRGLEAARFNDEESVIAFAGISAHVCPLRATDSYANQTLSHIRDATHDKVPKGAENIGLAGSKLTSAMDFHSDRFSGDILALHVRDDGGATAGGEQFFASFWKIYNELLETDPTVLETMAEPNWPFELKQKNSAPYLEPSPTLFFSKGKPIVQLVKAPLLGSPHIARDPSMPSLSPAQMHALAAVEHLAKKHCVQLDRQNGDIQFINNLSIMHARAAYDTPAGTRSSRHLLRMFLRDPAREWEKTGAYVAKFDDPFTPGRRQELPIVDLDPRRKISGRDSHG